MEKDIINAFEKCFCEENESCPGCYQGGPGFGFQCRKNLCMDVLTILKNRQDVVRCKDCKYSTYYYERFGNNYVCKKNMDNNGKIPSHDLKGHNGWWFCADGERENE